MGWFQALEQVESMLKEIAPIAASYFNNLVAQGFTRQEALELVKTWQECMMRPTITPE